MSFGIPNEVVEGIKEHFKSRFSKAKVQVSFIQDEQASCIRIQTEVAITKPTKPEKASVVSDQDFLAIRSIVGEHVKYITFEGSVNDQRYYDYDEEVQTKGLFLVYV